MRAVVAYIATTIVFFAIDIVWLGVVARDFYREALGPLLAQPMRLDIAGVFYLMYGAGIVFFAILPALERGRPASAFWRGALFGFFCYGTYDFTNMATIQDWPFIVSAIDIPWGMTITGVSALAGAWATARLMGAGRASTAPA